MGVSNTFLMGLSTTFLMISGTLFFLSLGFDLIRNQPKRILNNELIKTKEERIRKAKIAKYCGVIALVFGLAYPISYVFTFLV